MHQCRQVLRRNGGPSLADQISDRIAAQILECEFGPGSRLPGQRALARRLQVDRRTVGLAYRRLAARGLVEMKERSGAVVRSARGGSHRTPVPGWTPGDRLFAALVEARRGGVSAPELAGTVAVWSAVIRDRRVAVVCSEPELTVHIRAELAAALPELSYAECAAPGQRRNVGLPLVVMAGGGPNGAQLPNGLTAPGAGLAGVTPIPVHLGLSHAARTALALLQDGQVVAVISRSETARRIARRAILTLPEPTLGIAEADPEKEDLAVRALTLSELVLGEVDPTLIQRAGFRGRCLPLKLVAPFSILAIRDKLDVPWQARTEPCSASRQRL